MSDFRHVFHRLTFDRSSSLCVVVFFFCGGSVAATGEIAPPAVQTHTAGSVQAGLVFGCSPPSFLLPSTLLLSISPLFLHTLLHHHCFFFPYFIFSSIPPSVIYTFASSLSNLKHFLSVLSAHVCSVSLFEGKTSSFAH